MACTCPSSLASIHELCAECLAEHLITREQEQREDAETTQHPRLATFSEMQEQLQTLSRAVDRDYMAGLDLMNDQHVAEAIKTRVRCAQLEMRVERLEKAFAGLNIATLPTFWNAWRLN